MIRRMNQASSSDLNLRPRLVLLTGQAFSFGLTLALLIIPASAIFLSAFGSERLPYTYIVVALFGFVSASTLTALQRRWSLPRLAITTSLLLVVLFFSAWLALILADALWVSFVLLVVFSLFIQIGFVYIGGQAGRLFDVRQLKRLFPRVVSGFAMGFLVGGLVAVPLVNWLGKAENLLLATIASVLLLLVLQALTSRRFQLELSQSAADSSQQAHPSLRQLLSKRFVALIFLYQMLAAMGSQLLDFMLLDQAARRFTGSEALAQFFGNFTWVLNLTEILFLALLAGYLLNRFGLRFGLAANPAGVGVLAAAALLAGILISPLSLPFFLLIVISRISNIALNDGTTRTSLNAAYLALPPSERLAVQTGVEGIGNPLALGVVGALLLGYTAVPGLNVLHLLAFTLFLAAGWFALGNLVFRDYAANLLQILKRRVLGEAELTIADSSTLAVVERLVRSDQLREVRLGLDMLADSGHDSLPGHLISLVENRRPEIQVEALGRIESLGLSAALPAVEKMIETGSHPGVTGAALRAFAALRMQASLSRLLPFLDHPQERVRLGCMVALLRYAGPSGLQAVESRLHEMEKVPEPAQRGFLARVIGEAGIPGLNQPLTALLQDRDQGVRRAALVAASRSPHPSLLAPAVENLEHAGTRSAAIAALTSSGADVFPYVEQALAENDRKKARWLLAVCRQIKTPAVADKLRDHIQHPDREIRLQVLSTLAACDYQAAEAEKPAIRDAVQQEVRFVLRILAALADLEENQSLAALRRGLKDEMLGGIQQIFYLLSFLYDNRAMCRAASHLRQSGSQSQALALEVMDVVLSQEIKSWVLPLVEPDRKPEDRIQALVSRFPVERLTCQDRLRELLQNGDQEWPPEWIRICAFYAAHHLGMAGMITRSEGGQMLLTVEKVALLSQVEIFAGTPDYILAAVAQIIEEVELEPGQTFIQEGAVEDCMYVVVEGKVRVHSNDRTIIVLEPGNTVGELAVLDPEPRSASVSAVDHVLLFRLAKEPFDEVMADRPEIAQGVIRALTNRLRVQGHLAAAN